MNLKSTNKVETNKYELEIQVNVDEFEQAVQKAYLKQRKKINVPGFRVGKAPRKMIEKMYGEAVFYDEAVNAVYPSAISDAVAEAKLELVDSPSVEATEVSKENGVTFKATCITKPEVEVADYKGISIEKKVDEVTDEAINNEIEKLRQQGMRVTTVEDRAAQNDDEVVIDFEGFKDNVAFEGGKAENFNLTLGSGQFIPGFEDAVIGHNIGDEFDINVSFPEEYQVKELAGQPVVFKVKLNEIKQKELPEVNDDFVKDTTEFDTVEELNADLKKKLEEAAQKKADAEAEGSMMDKVIDGMTAEIPEVMYERRIDSMQSDFENRLAQQGLNIEMYLQYSGMDKDSFRKTFEEQAHRQVKLRLALEKIAQVENIEVSAEDVENEFAKIAEQYKMEVEKIKTYINEEDLKKDIAVEKAVELIKTSAVIK